MTKELNMSGPAFDSPQWDQGYNAGYAVGINEGRAQLYDFAKLFLDPEMYGHSVTAEVRDAARRIMGIPATEVLAQMGIRETD